MSGRCGKTLKSIAALAVGPALAGMCLAQQALAASLPEGAARLQPHRALYQMSLAEVRQGSTVTGARGVMYYRFEPRCDGWEVETRVALRLMYGAAGDAEVVDTKWSFSSFETFDGKSLSFQVDHSRDDDLLEIYDGDAFRDPKTGGGNASFYVPGGTTAKLPNGTLFPARHLLHLLSQARAGSFRDLSSVFDGASIVNPYQVNTVIVGPASSAAFAGLLPVSPPLDGAAAEKATALPAKLDTGPAVKRHPVTRFRLAYFRQHQPTGMPDFELQIDYRDDGVATHIQQDFGDFALDLTPSRIEALPLPVCGK